MNLKKNEQKVFNALDEEIFFDTIDIVFRAGYKSRRWTSTILNKLYSKKLIEFKLSPSRKRYWRKKKL